MFSNALIAFLAACGAGAWIYAKAYRSSGGQTKQAAIIAGISGFLIFLLLLLILGALFKS